MLMMKRTQAIAFVSILLIAGFLSILDSANADLSDPSSLKDQAIISINGDANFTLANGVTSGSGTQVDPYIIENISMNLSTNDIGISILDTRAYFIIRNCWIKGGVSLLPDYGIFLRNATNGTIENCRISGTVDIGIYIRDF